MRRGRQLPGGRERAVEGGRRGSRVGRIEDEDRDRLADPEGPQARRQLAAVEVAAQCLGEDVSGQPPLGLAHRPLAHQLERDDRGRLLEDQALGLAQTAGVGDREEPRARRGASGREHRQRQRAARDARMVRRERGFPRTGRGDACADGRDRVVRHLAGERARGDHLAVRREDHCRPADRRRDRARHLVEPALVEQQPLQPPVRCAGPLKSLVLAVHQMRERLFRDCDERKLVRHLEDGEGETLGRGDDALRNTLVLEARSEAKPGEVMARQPPHQLALAGRRRELDPGREYQLAARQPRRRVEQLGAVHPAHGGVSGLAARYQLEPHLSRQAPDGQHGQPRLVVVGGPVPGLREDPRAIRSQASVRTPRRIVSIS